MIGEMNMDELVKDLEFAYRMISNIPVSGDAVDMMASARAKLRKVFVELKAKEQKEGDSNGE
jgi:hypothetical protein